MKLKKKITVLSILALIPMLSGCSIIHYPKLDMSKQEASYQGVTRQWWHHGQIGMYHGERNRHLNVQYANHEAPIQNAKFSKRYHTNKQLYPKSFDGNYWSYVYSHKNFSPEYVFVNNPDNLLNGSTPSGFNKVRHKYFKYNVVATLSRDDIIAEYKYHEKPVQLSKAKSVHNLLARLDGLSQTDIQYIPNNIKNQKHCWSYYFAHYHPQYKNFGDSHQVAKLI